MYKMSRGEQDFCSGFSYTGALSTDEEIARARMIRANREAAILRETREVQKINPRVPAATTNPMASLTPSEIARAFLFCHPVTILDWLIVIIFIAAIASLLVSISREIPRERSGSGITTCAHCGGVV
jgi:hypothetical protein